MYTTILTHSLPAMQLASNKDAYMYLIANQDTTLPNRTTHF